MWRLTISSKRWAVGAYLGFSVVVMPLLAVRRVLGTGEPAEFRNLVLPLLLALMVVAFGALKVLVPRTWLQLLLAAVFVQALTVGALSSNHIEEPRNFLSHLYHIGSAYLMIGIGWLSIHEFGKKYWRNWSVLALVALGISSAQTFGALARGDVGRLYTPAYVLLLVVAYASVYWKRGLLPSILLAIASNKRAVVLAIAVQSMCSWLIGVLARSGWRQIWSAVAKATGVAMLAGIVVFAIIRWAHSDAASGGGLAMAVEVSVQRLGALVEFSSGSSDLSSLSSARALELEGALDAARWWNWVFGGGAGWSVDVGDGRSVHYLHTSPVSIALTFGLPFSILLYGGFGWVILRSARVAASTDDPTSAMAPIYLSGALVHSLFTYSLFVDLLVFFFAGVAMRAASSRPNEGRLIPWSVHRNV